MAANQGAAANKRNFFNSRGGCRIQEFLKGGGGGGGVAWLIKVSVGPQKRVGTGGGYARSAEAFDSIRN